MSVQNSCKLKSFTNNGVTYDSDTGGTIRLEYSNGSTPLEDKTGDDFYSRQVMLIGASERVRVTLRNVNISTDLGTAGTTSAIVTDGKGGNYDIPFGNMILYDVSANQPFEAPGACVLSYVHQSADGQTNPKA